MIKVSHLTKSYGKHKIINDLSFKIKKGEMVAITGPSGKGKSTLLNCIGLLDKFDSGEITLDGQKVSKMSVHNKMLFLRNTIGYLFQNFALIDTETVAQNMTYALTYQGLDKAQKEKAIKKALKKVGLEKKYSDNIYTLSGGEQQRVALARLMLKKATIILADEPTGSLDKKNGDKVMDSLRQMQKRKTTICIVTHDRNVVAQCDREIKL